MDATIGATIAASGSVSGLNCSNISSSSSSNSSSSGYLSGHSAASTPATPISSHYDPTTHTTLTSASAAAAAAASEHVPTATVAPVTPFYSESTLAQQQRQQYYQSYGYPSPATQFNPVYDAYTGNSYHNLTASTATVDRSLNNTGSSNNSSQQRLPKSSKNISSHSLANSSSSQHYGSTPTTVTTTTAATTKPQATATPFFAQPSASVNTSSTAYYDPYAKYKMPSASKLSSQTSADYAASYTNHFQHAAAAAASLSYQQQQQHYYAAKSQLQDVNYVAAAAAAGVKSHRQHAANTSSAYYGSGNAYYDKYEKYMYGPTASSNVYGPSSTTHTVQPHAPPPHPYSPHEPTSADPYRKAAAAVAANAWHWNMEYAAATGNCRTLPPTATGSSYLPSPSATVSARDPFCTVPADKYSKYDKYSAYYASHHHPQQYLTAPTHSGVTSSSATARNLWASATHHTPHLANVPPGISDRLSHTLPPSSASQHQYPHSHTHTTHHPFDAASTASTQRQSCCAQPYQQQSCYYPRPTQQLSHAAAASNMYATPQQSHYSAGVSNTGSNHKYSAYSNNFKSSSSNDLYLTSPFETSPPAYNYASASTTAMQNRYANAYYNDLNAQSVFENYANNTLSQAPAMLQSHVAGTTHNVAGYPATRLAYHQTQSANQNSGSTATLLDYRKPPAATATDCCMNTSRVSLANLEQHVAGSTGYMSYDLHGNSIAQTHSVITSPTLYSDGGSSSEKSTPTTKNLSIRDFISTWNEEEEEELAGATDQLGYIEATQPSVASRSYPVETSGEPVVPQPAKSQQPQQQVADTQFSYKAPYQVHPKIHVGISVDESMDVEASQYINLPDIVIDIEKSGGVAPGNPTAAAATTMEEKSISTAASASPLGHSSPCDEHDIFENFDVEKELDELQIKRAKLCLEKQLNNEIRILTPEPIVEQVQQVQQVPQSLQLSEEILQDTVKHTTEPLPYQNANTVQPNDCEKSFDHAEQFLKEMELNDTSSHSSNSSTFEKEYETFINRIELDKTDVERAQSMRRGTVIAAAFQPAITNEDSASVSHQSSDIKTPPNPMERDEMTEEESNLQDFTMFYKKKRKLVQESKENEANHPPVKQAKSDENEANQISVKEIKSFEVNVANQIPEKQVKTDEENQKNQSPVEQFKSYEENVANELPVKQAKSDEENVANQLPEKQAKSDEEIQGNQPHAEQFKSDVVNDVNQLPVKQFKSHEENETNQLSMNQAKSDVEDQANQPHVEEARPHEENVEVEISKIVNIEKTTKVSKTIEKKIRKRKILKIKTPKKLTKARRRPVSRFYKILRRSISARSQVKTTILVQKQIELLKERHLPLIKRQSFKNFSTSFKPIYNPHSLKCLMVSIVNTNAFQAQLMKDYETELKQNNCSNEELKSKDCELQVQNVDEENKEKTYNSSPKCDTLSNNQEIDGSVGNNFDEHSFTSNSENCSASLKEQEDFAGFEEEVDNNKGVRDTPISLEDSIENSAEVEIVEKGKIEERMEDELKKEILSSVLSESYEINKDSQQTKNSINEKVCEKVRIETNEEEEKAEKIDLQSSLDSQSLEDENFVDLNPISTVRMEESTLSVGNQYQRENVSYLKMIAISRQSVVENISELAENCTIKEMVKNHDSVEFAEEQIKEKESVNMEPPCILQDESNFISEIISSNFKEDVTDKSSKVMQKDQVKETEDMAKSTNAEENQFSQNSLMLFGKQVLSDSPKSPEEIIKVEEPDYISCSSSDSLDSHIEKAKLIEARNKDKASLSSGEENNKNLTTNEVKVKNVSSTVSTPRTILPNYDNIEQLAQPTMRTKASVKICDFDSARLNCNIPKQRSKSESPTSYKSPKNHRQTYSQDINRFSYDQKPYFDGIKKIDRTKFVENWAASIQLSASSNFELSKTEIGIIHPLQRIPSVESMPEALDLSPSSRLNKTTPIPLEENSNSSTSTSTSSSSTDLTSCENKSSTSSSSTSDTSKSSSSTSSSESSSSDNSSDGSDFNELKALERELSQHKTSAEWAQTREGVENNYKALNYSNAHKTDTKRIENPENAATNQDIADLKRILGSEQDITDEIRPGGHTDDQDECVVIKIEDLTEDEDCEELPKALNVCSEEYTEIHNTASLKTIRKEIVENKKDKKQQQQHQQNIVIPKLSDLCKIALNSSFVNNDLNVNQNNTYKIKMPLKEPTPPNISPNSPLSPRIQENSNIQNSSLLTTTTTTTAVTSSTTLQDQPNNNEMHPHELSVEEALAEMYRQAGVTSDPEDNGDNALNSNDNGENQAQDYLLINLAEILENNDNESNIFVLQCDMNENILRVMTTSPREVSNNAEILTGDVVNTGNTVDRVSALQLVQILNAGDLDIINESRNEIAQLPSSDSNPVDDEIDESNSSYIDLPFIHHEEIVPDNYKKFEKEQFLKYLHEKYVQQRVNRFYHANRILKKYRRYMVKKLSNSRQS